MKLIELHEGVFDNLKAKYKAWKERRTEQGIQKVWDNKSDESIMTAYRDAQDWLSLSAKTLGSTAEQIHGSARERLNKWILPQMKKRGLSKRSKKD